MLPANPANIVRRVLALYVRFDGSLALRGLWAAVTVIGFCRGIIRKYFHNIKRYLNVIHRNFFVRILKVAII